MLINRVKQFLPVSVKNKVRPWYYLFIMTKNRLAGAASIDVSWFEANPKSDISEHLNFLYFYLHTAKPINILELGTRGGESTRVIEKYCREMNIVGKSIDLEAAPPWLRNSKNWKHFIGDDIKLGQNLNFSQRWPDGSEFEQLDFILLDTSHEYSHTKEELATYLPLLKSGIGAIAFHDTNLTSSPTLRLDGSVGYGHDNERGVARAIEETFGFIFDERSLHMQSIPKSKLLFYHQPWCNGFSILIPNSSMIETLSHE